MNLLHNMSAPPRTRIFLSGEPVSGKTTVVCFLRALARKVKPAATPQGTFSKHRASANGKRGARWNWKRDGIPRIGHELPDSLPKLSLRLQDLFESPADLFAIIGQPIAPAWKADFLIGYRVRHEDLEPESAQENQGTSNFGISPPNPVFCKDPLLCAGILSRCAGPLFLNRRAPLLTWDTLLDLPIAFDDPLAIIP